MLGEHYHLVDLAPLLALGGYNIDEVQHFDQFQTMVFIWVRQPMTEGKEHGILSFGHTRKIGSI